MGLSDQLQTHSLGPNRKQHNPTVPFQKHNGITLFDREPYSQPLLWRLMKLRKRDTSHVRK